MALTGMARRRQDRERQKRRSIRRYWWMDPNRAIKMASTRQHCRCEYCLNRRQFDGPTMQERRAQEAYRAELFELGLLAFGL